MQQRRDEILAKKAKLAELKRQRELRASQNQSQAVYNRTGMSSPNEVCSPLSEAASYPLIARSIATSIADTRTSR